MSFLYFFSTLSFIVFKLILISLETNHTHVHRQPSRQPSSQPSRLPSMQPSSGPSRQPSGQPSRRPSSQPSRQPISQPSRQPSARPSVQPSCQPSARPSQQPSQRPTRYNPLPSLKTLMLFPLPPFFSCILLKLLVYDGLYCFRILLIAATTIGYIIRTHLNPFDSFVTPF